MSETIRYNGKDLPVFTSATPCYWPEGKKFVGEHMEIYKIYSYTPTVCKPFLGDYEAYDTLAELPAPEKKRWTNRELAEWTGRFGMVLDAAHSPAWFTSSWGYTLSMENSSVPDYVRIRDFGSNEIREPEGRLPWEVEE